MIASAGKAVLRFPAGAIRSESARMKKGRSRQKTDQKPTELIPDPRRSRLPIIAPPLHGAARSAQLVAMRTLI
jgi:hypothetical protein